MKKLEPKQNFIGKRNGRNMYDFRCKCGAECELGVPDKHLVIDCPNAPHCLEMFVQRKAVGLFAEPRLLTVFECMT